MLRARVCVSPCDNQRRRRRIRIECERDTTTAAAAAQILANFLIENDQLWRRLEAEESVNEVLKVANDAQNAENVKIQKANDKKERDKICRSRHTRRKKNGGVKVCGSGRQTQSALTRASR